jgi:hypothetical protein
MRVGIVFAVAYHVLAVGSFHRSNHVCFTVESELSLSVVSIDPSVFKELQ